ncbi:hypothetical protein JK386_02560 [Nocardioides sp. zg-536]|uniref:Uncharacterized protein n=1 Tax=Nocardioides faecalis TaxID=2803858 RepID=A0A938Y5S7_9ACTN|nr:hypothetical protein [Nocardioides faecalis]MBM9458768.1 hypothetical protein [Nocardioides faecalis]QVI60186.1 hypothetical protein KG111_07820 [Nocardioides faecalis]
MLTLLELPVIIAVAALHRYIQLYAPSNVLVRRVRAQEPRCIAAALLGFLAAVLLVAMHLLSEAVAAGAPGWLNLGVLVLAWDELKVGWLAVSVIVRAIVGVAPVLGARRSSRSRTS